MSNHSIPSSRVACSNRVAGRRLAALVRVICRWGGIALIAALLLFTARAADAQYGITPQIVSENAGTVTFTLTYNGAPTRTITWETQNRTAEAPGDFNAVSGSESLAKDESHTFTITFVDDDEEEAYERFVIRIDGGPDGASNLAVNILDDDRTPEVEFNLSSSTVEEASGNMIAAVARLNPPSANQVTVDYRTVDVSAQSPGDYTANSGTLTFAPSDREKTIEVSIVDDMDNELPETFDIELTSATNATLGTIKTHTATITQPSSERIPADCATSEADLNLTRTTSGTSATVTGADYKEGGQSVFVFLADEEGPLASRCEGTPVWLNYEIGTASDEATFGTDYTVEVNNSAVTSQTGSLLFTRAKRQHTIVVKSVAESPAVRELLETMTLIFNDPDRLDISATSGYQSSTMSLGYIIGFQDASPAPDLEIRGAVGGHSTAETGGLTYDFAVELKANPWIVEDVTVECDTVDGTATAGEDYTALTRHVLTFQPSELTSGTSLTKSCPIAIIDDALDEAAETLTLEISAPTGGAIVAGGATTDSETLTILEDASDPAPVATLSATPATVSEAGATYSFDVMLDTPTGRDKLLVGYRLGGTATLGEDYFVSGPNAVDATGQFEIVQGAMTSSGPGGQFMIIRRPDLRARQVGPDHENPQISMNFF